MVQEAALKIMLFMWCVSFSVLGGQYVIGDVLGVTLENTWTDFDGDGDVDDADHIPIKSHLLTIIDIDTINTTSENIVSANFTNNSTYYDKVETFTTGAAFVAWEVITLLSGTYIFNLMYIMGIPIIFVAFFVILYLVLLGRAIILYVRGT
jgi:hypothetical protein